MNFSFALFALPGLLFCGCGDKSPSPRADSVKPAATDSQVVSQQFFPVADFIRNEIDYVDSLPVGIKKYTTAGSVTDSAYIPLGEFHRLAKEFQADELKDPVFKKSFRETSFIDRVTNNATFFYSSTDTGHQVKRVDVVTSKGDIYDEVRSIYIEKSYYNGDSSITKRLIWKPKRNFQIITLSSGNSGEPKTNLIKVEWDNRD